MRDVCSMNELSGRASELVISTPDRITPISFFPSLPVSLWIIRHSQGLQRINLYELSCATMRKRTALAGKFLLADSFSTTRQWISLVFKSIYTTSGTCDTEVSLQTLTFYFTILSFVP